MFSIVFPGQGSQKIGMVKEFYEKYDLAKRLFKDADAILNVPITKIIFEGPENKLNSTENTQPAIFLASYCIFEIIKKEFGYDFKKFKYFAGHSLGEYSALACVGSISFEDTLKILQKRGKFMQEAVPSGEGAMLAVLGMASKELDKIFKVILKYFNGKKIGKKYAGIRSSDQGKGMINEGFALDDSVPVELFYGEKVKLYLGVTSTGLANIESGFTISIAYLINYKDVTRRDNSVANQERRKKNKIYYPKDLKELDTLLAEKFKLK